MASLFWRLAFDDARVSPREAAIITGLGDLFFIVHLREALALGGGDPTPEAYRSAAEAAAGQMAQLFPDLGFRTERAADRGPMPG